MIEPRGSIRILRRESSVDASPGSSSQEAENVRTEIHPNLEYERSSWLSTTTDDDSQHSEYERADDSRPQHVTSTNTITSSSVRRKRRKDVKLLLSFIGLIITGASHSVLAKLQAIPLYNYPSFLNLFSNLLYIPLCFAYILPVAFSGNSAIPRTSLTLPLLAKHRRPFLVMGLLDCLAVTMQIFASIYVPGPLLILLPQAAIPVSIIFSKYLLGERFHMRQLFGAMIVVLGIVVVLEPVVTLRRSPEYVCQALDLETTKDCVICQDALSEEDCLAHGIADREDETLAFVFADNTTTTHVPWLYNATSEAGDTGQNGSICQWLAFDEATREKDFLTFFWSFVMMASTIPMALSTIYKQVALDDGIELDPIFLNGWIAIYQCFFSLLLAVPTAWLASPRVLPADLPRNLFQGLKCYLGMGSIHTGCHPDMQCSQHAALYVNLCLLSNVLYTLCMMLVVKYGSTSLLFLALTVIVPIGNVSFSLPFVPESVPMHMSDLVGLAVIVGGLFVYRFVGADSEECNDLVETDDQEATDLSEGLLSSPRAKHWPQSDLDSLRRPLLSGDV